MQILRQSTAVDVLIGPFLDLTDAATAETGESPSVKLSKNGQALAAKADITTPVHDADGYYNCELDATDTNTVGTLVLTVAASANALPIRHEYTVVEESVYDNFYASAAVGPLTAAQVNAECDTAITDAALATAANLATVDANVDAILVDTGTDIPARFDGIEGATFNTTTDSLEAIRNQGDAAWITATGFSTHSAADVWTAVTRTLTANTNLNDPTAATIAGAVWDEAQASHVAAGSFGLIASEIADILVDTAELQGDWADGGRLDLILDARASQVSVDTVDGNVDLILADTGTDGVVISTATAQAIADELLKRDMSAVVGEAARSPLNALRFLRNKWSISGTTLTVTEEDDITAAWTATVTVDATADPVTGNDPA